MEVTKWLKPSISVSRIGDSASVQAATRVNAEQSSKRTMRRSCPAGADSNDLQRAIAPAKASRGGNAALRAIRLRMYSAIRMPSGAENQMQIRSEAVL